MTRRRTRLIPVIPRLLAEHLRPLDAGQRLAVLNQLEAQAGKDRALDILTATVPLLKETPHA
ncbi:MAG TPA: hypothetical protein VI172_08240 [Candidatus Dormibacteraeota bacterium]|jgi:hypothetical protein